jgi:hypothetical protein
LNAHAQLGRAASARRRRDPGLSAAFEGRDEPKISDVAPVGARMKVKL